MAASLYARSSLLAKRVPSTSWRCLNAGKQERAYSIKADDASDPKLSAIDPSQLSIQKTTTPKNITANEELVFGRQFTGWSHDTK